MEKLTPEHLRSLLLQLQEISLEVVVVGGQAVNLWANFYRERVPQLEEYLPFASEDLDFYGGRLEALACHQVLGGQIFLNQDFDPSPNAGIVTVNYQSQKLRIDFLASVYGLSEAEIVSTAIPFLGAGTLSGLSLKVLHPALCLEGKLKCLKGLPQQNRQDLKHVKMSLLCLRQLMSDLGKKGEISPFLRLAERILNNAINETGLHAWYHHNIVIESAIPVEPSQILSDERWQKFIDLRLPNALQQLTSKRVRYSDLMKRIAGKNIN
jgi:hypothetical protein